MSYDAPPPVNVRPQFDGVTRPNTPIGGVMGLTKREWFAGMALQGLLAVVNPDNELTDADASRSAVRLADALIAALNES